MPLCTVWVLFLVFPRAAGPVLGPTRRATSCRWDCWLPQEKQSMPQVCSQLYHAGNKQPTISGYLLITLTLVRNRKGPVKPRAKQAVDSEERT